MADKGASGVLKRVRTKAVEDVVVLRLQGLTMRAAIRAVGLGPTKLTYVALKQRVQRRLRVVKNGDGRRLLTDEQELVVYSALVALDSNLRAATSNDIRVVVRKVLGDDEATVSWQWIQGFLERFAGKVSAGRDTPLTKNIADATLVLAVESFISTYGHLRKSVSQARVFNFDQMWVTCGPDTTRRVVYTTQQHDKAVIWRQKNFPVVCVAPIVSAAGDLVMMTVVVPLKGAGRSSVVVVERDNSGERVKVPLLITYNDTGMFTSSMFIEVLDHLARELATDHNFDVPLLLYDGAAAHTAGPVREWAELNANSLRLLRFPPRLTFLMQPLDNTAFAACRKAMGNFLFRLSSFKATRRFEKQDIGSVGVTRIVTDMLSTRSVVQKAWADVHLEPFDAAKLRERVLSRVAPITSDPQVARVAQAVREMSQSDPLQSIGVSQDTFELLEVEHGSFSVVRGSGRRVGKRPSINAECTCDELDGEDERCAACTYKKSRKQVFSMTPENQCQVPNCSTQYRGGRKWFRCAKTGLVACSAHSGPVFAAWIIGHARECDSCFRMDFAAQDDDMAKGSDQ